MNADINAYESLLAAQETAKWTYWIMFATWFAGAATFFAVVVSLYFANRKPLPKINVSTYSDVIMPGRAASLGMVIDVTNIGLVPVIIKSLDWEFRGKVKKVKIWEETVCYPVSKRLNVSESVLFYVEFAAFPSEIKSFKSKIIKSYNNLNRVKIVVTLSTGYKKKQKLDRESIRFIKDY